MQIFEMRFSGVLGALFYLALGCLNAVEPSPSAWDEIDIVPMPKDIQLSGRWIPLQNPQEPVSIVLGAQPCRQARIGADWINQRMIALGGAALPLQPADPARTSAWSIIIGHAGDNALIRRAAESQILRPVNTAAAGESSVPPRDAQSGAKGYAIKVDAPARHIYLAGTDPIGVLYACVTFAELTDKTGGQIAWRAADILDWPDFLDANLGVGWTGGVIIPELNSLVIKAICEKPTPEFRARYLAAMQAHYDRLLRRKITWLDYECYHLIWGNKRDAAPESLALIREGNMYGRERGIRSLILTETFEGLKRDYPGMDSELRIPGRYEKWLRGWDPRFDEIRKETAARQARYYNALGISDIGLHDTDTGGFLNPGQWNERSEASRQRWGDDYAAATIHKWRAYYDAFKREAPEIRLHLVLYPYHCDFLADPPDWGFTVTPQQHEELQAKYIDFWRRLARELPADMTFAVREAPEAAIRRFQDLVKPHPLCMAYYYFSSRTWIPSFTEGPRFVRSFYTGPGTRDFFYAVGMEAFVPLQALATREYAWNTVAPGAGSYYSWPDKEQWRHAEPTGAVYTVVLPHVVRNLFGRTAAPEITRAVSFNIAPNQIFQDSSIGLPNKPNLLTNPELMNEQARRAQQAAAEMDTAWRKLQADGMLATMPGYSLRRLVYLREVLHHCRWMAAVQAKLLQSRELAYEQDLDGAALAADEGLQLAQSGKAAVAQLLKERPPDPVLDTPDYNQWCAGWRRFMADSPALDNVAARLEQTKRELGELGPVPKPIAGILANQRIVRAFQASARITADGRLDEPSWAGAWPVETFFVHGQSNRIARAHTRARLLYDAMNIYLGLENWMPGNSSIQGRPASEREFSITDESDEVFIHHSRLGNDYVHFMVNPAGSTHCQWNHYNGSEQKGWTPDNAWVCEGLKTATRMTNGHWIMEMIIPIVSLGGQGAETGWSVNLARNCALAGGETEQSSIQRTGARGFHDQAGFRPVTWMGSAAFTPWIALEPAALTLETRTLPDRIASVAVFGMRAAAGQVLHNAVLQADAYGADGQWQNRLTCRLLPRMYYEWQSAEPLTLAFQQVSEQAGIRLVLTSDEAREERWIRLGGWEAPAGTDRLYGTNAPIASHTGDFRATPYLADTAYLPSFIAISNGQANVAVMATREGTVEFWMKPAWPGYWPLPVVASEYRQASHAVFHYGARNRAHPHMWNWSGLAVCHDDAHGVFGCRSATPDYVAWNSHLTIHNDRAWAANQWRHIAIVWDASAQRADWLRIYVAGRRQAGLSGINHEDRLDADKSVRLNRGGGSEWIQIGSLLTGRCYGLCGIDEFRISRIARYGEAFQPTTTEAALDRDTTALFHFNRSLAGEGMSPDGRVYTVKASAGSPYYD